MPKTLLDSGSDLFEPIITMLSSEVEHLSDQTVLRKPKVRNTGSQAARLSQLHADVAPPVQLTCGERANVFFRRSGENPGSPNQSICMFDRRSRGSGTLQSP